MKEVWEGTGRRGDMQVVLHCISRSRERLEKWTQSCRRRSKEELWTKCQKLREAYTCVRPETWKWIREIEKQLDGLLNTNERFWQQKAKVEWLWGGDKNT